MHNLIQSYQREKVLGMGSSGTSDQTQSRESRASHFQLVLDNLPENSKKAQLEQILNKKKLVFMSAEILSHEESVQFPGTGLVTLSAKLTFASKSDLSKCAHEIVNKQSFALPGVKSKKQHFLQMRILKKGANFNPESSIFIR